MKVCLTLVLGFSDVLMMLQGVIASNISRYENLQEPDLLPTKVLNLFISKH